MWEHHGDVGVFCGLWTAWGFLGCDDPWVDCSPLFSFLFFPVLWSALLSPSLLSLSLPAFPFHFSSPSTFHCSPGTTGVGPQLTSLFATSQEQRAENTAVHWWVELRYIQVRLCSPSLLLEFPVPGYLAPGAGRGFSEGLTCLPFLQAYRVPFPGCLPRGFVGACGSAESLPSSPHPGSPAGSPLCCPHYPTGKGLLIRLYPS